MTDRPLPSSKISPKVIYLTAGAGGMYCGSCLHDNTLAKALVQAGWNVQLVPTYTPIRTDETDVSVDHVLFGGLNVYLQQKVPILRYLPMFVDRVLDSPKLIRRVTARAIDTDASLLGSLALSMLKGIAGNQRKEVKRMTRWLVKEQPELLVFTNLLIGGCIPYLKSQIDLPILVTLQGDDIFLNSLKPEFKKDCLTQIKTLTPYVDGFIVHSEFFRQEMSNYFGIDLAKIFITPLGIDIADFQPIAKENLADASPDEVGYLDRPANDGASRTKRGRSIGYLARLAPEKGFHKLVEAFIRLKQRPGFADVTLQVAGWLGPPNEKFAAGLWEQLKSAGLQDDYHYWGSVDRQQKLEFLRLIDLLSVPTEMKEPKGLYALEALAAGVPFVLPDQGAFPELMQQTNGGYLYPAGDSEALVNRLAEVLTNEDDRRQRGLAGQKFVHQYRNAAAMAQQTGDLFEKWTGNATMPN